MPVDTASNPMKQIKTPKKITPTSNTANNARTIMTTPPKTVLLTRNNPELVRLRQEGITRLFTSAWQGQSGKESGKDMHEW
jgi:hypothetical protein